MPYIKYRKRDYKYQLVESYSIMTRIIGYRVTELYYHLDPDGLLTVHALYAWDGPSGPTLDTKDSMRGSLVHDVIYQMIRRKNIPEVFKDYADTLFRDICIEDGMDKARAQIWFEGVHLFGGRSCEPGTDETILTAP